MILSSSQKSSYWCFSRNIFNFISIHFDVHNCCLMIIMIVWMGRILGRCWIKDEVNFVKNSFIFSIIDGNIIIGRYRLRKCKSWENVTCSWKTTRINQLVDISIERKSVFVCLFINIIQLFKDVFIIFCSSIWR